MAKTCEACAALGPTTPVSANSKRVRNVLVGERIVFLCDTHAEFVLKQDLTSIDSIRAALRESDGNRSLVDRRSVLDRRAFPPRPEGRRESGGRRCSDGSR